MEFLQTLDFAYRAGLVGFIFLALMYFTSQMIVDTCANMFGFRGRYTAPLVLGVLCIPAWGSLFWAVGKFCYNVLFT